jgi:Raf kinase inhibitor-like YbhB/YbcL family protein
MFRKIIFISLAAVLIFLGASGNYPFCCKNKKSTDSLMAKNDTLPNNKDTVSLVVKSSAFADNAFIPKKYSCDADNVSPSLEWSTGPDSTKSYALICDDPDAPSKVWVHWVLFNIPASVNQLEENIPLGKTATGKVSQGINDSGDLGYSGPCPPGGVHHYHFRIYALDCILSLESGVSRKELDAAMQDHILAQGEIIGLYKRAK